MSGRIIVETKQHKTAGPYSGVTGVDPNASIFVISGQAPVDMNGDTIGKNFGDQSRITLDNCLNQLTQAGCDFSNVFKATIYLADLGDWPEFNEIYKEYFSEPYPARTAVGVQLLNGFQVEIEMWACKNEVG